MKMLRAEWLNVVKNKRVLVVLIAVMCVPMLYNLFFLGSFWDPYSKLSELPVVVINNDTGTELQGKSIHIGLDFVDVLQESKTFKWSFMTNKQQAVDRLERGDVFMVIEIPSDFSKDAVTLLASHPQKMKINYYTDPGNNYPASQIMDSAINKMEVQIADEVRKQYAKTMFSSLKSLANGFQQASDGAVKLEAGAQKLVRGTDKISTSMNKFTTGVSSFDNGLQSAHAGSVKLVVGLHSAAQNATALSEGTTKLAQGHASVVEGGVSLEKGLQQLDAAGAQLASSGNQVATSIGTLRNGLQQVTQSTGQLHDGMTAYMNGVVQVSSALQSLAQNAGSSPQLQQQLMVLSTQLNTIAGQGNVVGNAMTQVIGAQQQLYTGAQALASGSAQLASGMQAYTGKVTEAHSATTKLADANVRVQSNLLQVADGNQQLGTGLVKLEQGGISLDDGLGKLSVAGDQLVSGSQQLLAGMNKVQSGTISLASGIQELRIGLQDGASQAKDAGKATEATYDMFASPTELDAHVQHKIPTYGVGMAPYIISIALFACALMFTNAYPLQEPAMKPQSVWAWFWSKYSVVLAVATVGAGLASVFLLYGLDLPVQSTWRFVVLMLIVSITFLTILFVLTVALGKPGQFIGFIILLMQVAGSGGTFPKLLTPQFFQSLNPLLPMTYAIRGFRQVISLGNDYGFMWLQAGVLLGYLAVGIGLGFVAFKRMMRKELLAN